MFGQNIQGFFYGKGFPRMTISADCALCFEHRIENGLLGGICDGSEDGIDVAFSVGKRLSDAWFDLGGPIGR